MPLCNALINSASSTSFTALTPGTYRETARGPEADSDYRCTPYAAVTAVGATACQMAWLPAGQYVLFCVTADLIGS
jgi:hypothetical protein